MGALVTRWVKARLPIPSLVEVGRSSSTSEVRSALFHCLALRFSENAYAMKD